MVKTQTCISILGKYLPVIGRAGQTALITMLPDAAVGWDGHAAREFLLVRQPHAFLLPSQTEITIAFASGVGKWVQDACQITYRFKVNLNQENNHIILVGRITDERNPGIDNLISFSFLICLIWIFFFFFNEMVTIS